MERKVQLYPKHMLKEQGNTWANALKENSKIRGSGPRQAKQRNLHHPTDHEEFSHLLLSINWWSSQKEKTTQRTYKQTKRVS